MRCEVSRIIAKRYEPIEALRSNAKPGRRCEAYEALFGLPGLSKEDVRNSLE